jgi:hypothetical protein
VSYELPAFRTQFVQRDPEKAARLWDEYLSRGGPLALEASYDRALCLVRLARRSEAVEALTPFADGGHGEYRRTEARRLIEAMAVEASK